MTRKIEAVEQIDYKSANKKLVEQLTKRNEQYIYDLDKALALANVSEMDRERLKHTMMTELVVGQKSGKTARQTFGTVSDQVKSILEGPKEDLSKPSADWKIFLDGALLMGSMFMIISGLSSTYQQLGLITLILNYFFAGAMMLTISKASKKFQHDIRSGGGRFMPVLKYILVTLACMAVWFVALGLLTLIPASFNPTLPKEIYLVIGVVTLGAKFYFKKKLNIRGGMF